MARTRAGAKVQAHTLIKDGSHFVCEDTPKELVDTLDQWVNSN